MRYILILGIFIIGCASKDTATGQAYQEVKIQDGRDLDKWFGKGIIVEGAFETVKGQHAIVTLDSRVKIYIPHFDKFRRGEDWLKYRGQRVKVGGILYSSIDRPIDNMPGPFLQVDYFEPVTTPP